MRIKMGTVVQKMGTTVPMAADQTRYRKAVAAALRAELGPTHQAIKTAMRWTGASGCPTSGTDVPVVPSVFSCYKTSDKNLICPRISNSMMIDPGQRARMIDYMETHAPARSRELAAIGVAATAISRAVSDGAIVRIGRGLYQLPDSEPDLHSALIEIAKRAPKAIICLTSAMSFHQLTDQLPRKVWIAIGATDWAPKIEYPQIRIVRFREPYLANGQEVHRIRDVEVRVYSVAKTIADAFRNPKLVHRSVAIEAMKSALNDRKATPGQLAAAAQENGAWNQMRPYLEALTSNG